MKRQSAVLCLPMCRHAVLVFTLAGSAVACTFALAGNGERKAEASLEHSSASDPMPGRIYVDASLNIPWTRYKVVSFDPTSDSWRIEPVPLGPAAFFRLSSHGETAAYVSGRSRADVFACSLNGSSDEVHLLSGPTWGLAWAPDAKRLAVTTSADEYVDKQWITRMQTWLVNADGSAKTRLPIPDTHVVLDWSADGTFLLTFVPSHTRPPNAREDFQDALYTIRPDGTGARRVTPQGHNASYGRISPDSQSIAYRIVAGPPRGQTGGFSAWKFRVCVVNSDGTGRKEVAHETTGGIPSPDFCWSPDGKYLAVQFCKWRESWGSISYSVSPESIEIYNLDGRRIQALAVPKEDDFRGGAIDWR